MRIRNCSRIRMLARIRRRLGRDGPVVLLYHRIADPATDPQLLSVVPERFAEHLELIGDSREPVSLAGLVAAKRDGEAPARAVALTFDDGYADNLLVAKPLLERSGVHATVFVTSGYLGGRRLFWWDELERLVLRCGHFPTTVALEIAGDISRWELAEDATYGSPDAGERAEWTVLDVDDPGPRQRMYRDLSVRLRALDEPERERVLEQLRLLSEPENGGADESPRPLTHEELARLGEGGLVDIGAHTVTHSTLSGLVPDRQQDEIVGGKSELEHVLGRRVSSFAYPYGARRDFDRTTVSLVQEAGFDHACTSIPGRFSSNRDRFSIPRLPVRNWSGDELARRLEELAP
jgi:peptidoglycan/xylan/chitin deacetylase (PgdA/CDA1 family)